MRSKDNCIDRSDATCSSRFVPTFEGKLYLRHQCKQQVNLKRRYKFTKQGVTSQIPWHYGCSVTYGSSARREMNNYGYVVKSRSQWLRGLRRRSAAARLLRLWVRIPPEAWTFVCCEFCVLSGRGLCDELIPRSKESYRLWCVVICDLETS